MASLNRVFLIGNLTRDPEVRYLPSGAAVADLRLAVSRKYKTQQGEDKEETCFVSVSAWGRQAETCGQYLSKGSPVMVEGRLRYEEWEKDGQKNNRLTVTAERIQFLSAGGGGGGSRGGSSEYAGDAPDTPSRGGSPQGGSGGGDVGDDDDLPF